MELRHLRTFVTVAERLNFTAAAAALHVAQPAVSQTIRDLEAEVGAPLFQRTKRSVRLTAAGRALLPEATTLLAGAASAVRDAQRAARGEVGRLSVAFMGSAAAPFLPNLVRQYRDRYPDVELSLWEMAPVQQAAAFAAGRIDVGFTRPLGEAAAQLELNNFPVYTDHVVAALPRGHRLAEGTSVRPKDLADEPLVMFHRHGAPGLFDLIVGSLGATKVAPRVAYQPDLMATVLVLVAAGLGVGLVPGCVHNLAHEGVEFRSLRPRSADVPLIMTWPRREDNPALDAWRELVRDSLPEIRQRMEA